MKLTDLSHENLCWSVESYLSWLRSCRSELESNGLIDSARTMSRCENALKGYLSIAAVR